MEKLHRLPNSNLAASITKAASRQTFYTVRLLADRDLLDDAYRAYAYFRWVDDTPRLCRQLALRKSHLHPSPEVFARRPVTGGLFRST